MSRHMGHRAALGQESRQPAALSRRRQTWFMIVNLLGLFRGLAVPSQLWPHHAIPVRARFMGLHRRGVLRLRRDPGVHHFEPGRRLRGRPVPGTRRHMRRPARAPLLPVTGFCPGFGLSPGRSRRNYRLRPQNRRKLPPWPLRRICRNHLPALICPELAHLRPTPGPRNDVTMPQEAAMEGALRPPFMSHGP